MSSPEQNKRELANTYMVQDRQSLEELERLKIQDQMITKSIGGPLAEQSDPQVFHSVLDVGCGAGDWVIEVARNYPTMALKGVDISPRMIEFAREQASKQQLADRVEFLVMDALRMLEFPSGSFDLVNARLAASFMRTWEWPKLLSEFQRMAKRGGIVRITEGDVFEGNSPALTAWEHLFMQALYKSGHHFHFAKDGFTRELERLLKQYGLKEVQTHEYVLSYPHGTPEGELFAADLIHGFGTLRPYIQKWADSSKDYDAISQQAIKEIQQPGFVVTWRYLTAWGNVDVS